MGILDSLEGGFQSLERSSGRRRPVQNLGIADALQWRQEQDLRQRRFDAEEAERQRQKEIDDRDFGIKVAEDRTKTMGDISKATLAGGRAAGEAYARQQSGYNEQTGRSEPYQVDTTGGRDTEYYGDLAGQLTEPSGMLGTGGEQADPGTFVSPLDQAGWLSRGQPDPVVDGPSVGAAEGAMEGNAGGGIGPADPADDAMTGIQSLGMLGGDSLQFDEPAPDAPRVDSGTAYETTVTAPGGEAMKLDQRSNAEALQTDAREGIADKFEQTLQASVEGDPLLENAAARVGGMLRSGVIEPKEAFKTMEGILAAQNTREAKLALAKLKKLNSGKKAVDPHSPEMLGKMADSRKKIISLVTAAQTAAGLKGNPAKLKELIRLKGLVWRAKDNPADAALLKGSFVRMAQGAGVLADSDMKIFWKDIGGKTEEAEAWVKKWLGGGGIPPGRLASVSKAINGLYKAALAGRKRLELTVETALDDFPQEVKDRQMAIFFGGKRLAPKADKKRQSRVDSLSAELDAEGGK